MWAPFWAHTLAWELENGTNHRRFDALFIPNVPPCSPSNIILIDVPMVVGEKLGYKEIA